jgi:type II protein arginine methyltransferase
VAFPSHDPGLRGGISQAYIAAVTQPNTYCGLETLLQQVDGKPAAMIALAQLLCNEGDRSLAVKLCTRALELAPNDGEVRTIAMDVLSHNVPRWHFKIVRDVPRNDAYEAALRRAVFPGCKVLEIGTGTGLLAMIAARAGAAEVITCETDSAIAAAAQDVIARNGFADRIRVIAKHSTRLDVEKDLRGPADILVSEIISDNLLREGSLPVVEHASRHLLKPSASILPAQGRVRVALGDHHDWESERMGQVAGFDLTDFNRLMRPSRELDVGTERLTVRSEPADLFAFKYSSGGPFPESSGEVTLIAESGPINGIVQWIALDMDAEGRYENRPGPGSTSSWSALFHPFERSSHVSPGHRVVVRARHDRYALHIWSEVSL